MNILDTIAENTRQRYKEIIKNKPLAKVKAEALEMPKGNFEFEKALGGDTLSFICEVKKASPSKGVIAEDFPYLQIAKEYETAGASAISCLTEPKWFMGKDEYLKEICENVSIPVLRKDFTISDYQIYEAKLLGAKAVLLICALLDTDKIKEYIDMINSDTVSDDAQMSYFILTQIESSEIGKGLFAQLLSDAIDDEFDIPLYIIEAIDFMLGIEK